MKKQVKNINIVSQKAKVKAKAKTAHRAVNRLNEKTLIGIHKQLVQFNKSIPHNLFQEIKKENQYRIKIGKIASEMNKKGYSVTSITRLLATKKINVKTYILRNYITLWLDSKEAKLSNAKNIATQAIKKISNRSSKVSSKDKTDITQPEVIPV